MFTNEIARLSADTTLNLSTANVAVTSIRTLAIIELACVKACAKEGAIVYMAARNLDAAKKTSKELNAHGYH